MERMKGFLFPFFNYELKFWSCLTTLSGRNVLQFSTKEMEKAAVAKKRKSELGTLKLPIGSVYIYIYIFLFIFSFGTVTSCNMD